MTDKEAIAMMKDNGWKPFGSPTVWKLIGPDDMCFTQPCDEWVFQIDGGRVAGPCATLDGLLRSTMRGSASVTVWGFLGLLDEDDEDAIGREQGMRAELDEAARYEMEDGDDD